MARRLTILAVLAFVLNARFSVIWGPDSALGTVGTRGRGAARRPKQPATSINGSGASTSARAVCTNVPMAAGIGARVMRPFGWHGSLYLVLPVGDGGREHNGTCHHGGQVRGGGGECRDTWRRLPIADVAVYFRTLLLFLLRRAQGRLGELDDWLLPVIDLTAGSVDPFDRHRGHVTQALRMIWLIDGGQVDAARRAFEAFADEHLQRLPKDAYWLANIVLLSQVAVSLADRERAAILYEELLPYANGNAIAGSGSHLPRSGRVLPRSDRDALRSFGRRPPTL